MLGFIVHLKKKKTWFIKRQCFGVVTLHWTWIFCVTKKKPQNIIPWLKSSPLIIIIHSSNISLFFFPHALSHFIFLVFFSFFSLSVMVGGYSAGKAGIHYPLSLPLLWPVKTLWCSSSTSKGGADSEGEKLIIKASASLGRRWSAQPGRCGGDCGRDPVAERNKWTALSRAPVRPVLQRQEAHK